MSDWYRKTSWNKNDEEDFFTRWKRSRDKAQYLKIQAITLVETKEEKWLDAGEMLLQTLLKDFPEDRLYKAAALQYLGHIRKGKGNLTEALEYYKAALDFEVVFPNILTNVFLDYAELVVQLEIENQYNYTRELLEARLKDNIFPVVDYQGNSILSILAYKQGDIIIAKKYEGLAEDAASKTTSGLSNHPNLGIVDEAIFTKIKRLFFGKK